MQDEMTQAQFDAEKARQLSCLDKWDGKRFEPRATEFLGTVYRSKCEAMFARFLELRCRASAKATVGRFPQSGYNSRASGFIYEPPGFVIDGWTPDFVVFRTLSASVSVFGMPHLGYEIIEYKPCQPTDTYRHEWSQRCKAAFNFMERCGWLDIAYRSSFALYYGSVFTSTRSSIWCEPDTGWASFDSQLDWLGAYEKDVRSTRFDLKASV